MLRERRDTDPSAADTPQAEMGVGCKCQQEPELESRLWWVCLNPQMMLPLNQVSNGIPFSVKLSSGKILPGRWVGSRQLPFDCDAIH